MSDNEPNPICGHIHDTRRVMAWVTRRVCKLLSHHVGEHSSDGHEWPQYPIYDPGSPPPSAAPAPSTIAPDPDEINVAEGCDPPLDRWGAHDFSDPYCRIGGASVCARCGHRRSEWSCVEHDWREAVERGIAALVRDRDAMANTPRTPPPAIYEPSPNGLGALVGRYRYNRR